MCIAWQLVPFRYYRNNRSAYPNILCNYLHFYKDKKQKKLKNSKKLLSSLAAQSQTPAIRVSCLQFNVIFICRFGSYCSCFFNFFFVFVFVFVVSFLLSHRAVAVAQLQIFPRYANYFQFPQPVSRDFHFHWH